MITIIIDRDSCMGAGECEFHAPLHFALDTARRSTVRSVAPQPENDAELEQILDAAASCPNFAIRVERDGVSLL